MQTEPGRRSAGDTVRQYIIHGDERGTANLTNVVVGDLTGDGRCTTA
jgi:hypothetical protein